MKNMASYPRILLHALMAIALLLPAGCGRKKAPEPPQYNNPIISYLKTPSPRALATKTLNLVGRTENTAQTGMLLTFFLAGYGFPQFHDFDPEAPLTLFYLQGETMDRQNLVLLAKAKPTARLVNEFAPALNLNVDEHGEWLFITQDPAVLALIKSREELIELALGKPAYDFEATFLSRGLIDAREQITANARARQKNADEAAAVWLDAILHVFFQELQSTDSLVVGVDIGPDALSGGMDLISFAGTRLGDTIAQGSRGRPSAGSHLHSRESVAYVMDMPARALQGYTDHLAESLASRLSSEIRADFQKVRQAIHNYLGEWSGLSAASISFRDTQPGTTLIHEGDFRIATIRSLYDSGNALQAAIAKAGDDEAEHALFHFTPEAGLIEGVPYHQAQLRFGTEDGDNEFMESSFFALIDADILQTNSLEALQKALEDLRRPLPAGESLAADFSARPNHWLQGRLHLGQYYREVAAGNPEALPGFAANPNVRNAILSLDDDDLEPVTFKVTSDGHRLSWSARLPLSIVDALLKKM